MCSRLWPCEYLCGLFMVIDAGDLCVEISLSFQQQGTADIQSVLLLLLHLNTSGSPCWLPLVCPANYQNRSAALMESVGTAQATGSARSAWAATIISLCCKTFAAWKPLEVLAKETPAVLNSVFRSALTCCVLIFFVHMCCCCCCCFLQIVIVKSQVGQEMFQKIAQRRSWSPGEEFSIDGKVFSLNMEHDYKMHWNEKYYFL